MQKRSAEDILVIAFMWFMIICLVGSSLWFFVYCVDNALSLIKG